MSAVPGEPVTTSKSKPFCLLRLPTARIIFCLQKFNSLKVSKEHGFAITAQRIGQIAFVTGEGEVTAAAKSIKNFAKKAEDVKIKIGILDGEVIDAEKINVLASLPSRDELLAKLLSVINEPGTSILRAINEKFGNSGSSDEEE